QRRTRDCLRQRFRTSDHGRECRVWSPAFRRPDARKHDERENTRYPQTRAGPAGSSRDSELLTMAASAEYAVPPSGGPMLASTMRAEVLHVVKLEQDA